MQVTAKLKFLRIAPRKVRLVANLIRGKEVEKAQAILSFTVKKASHPLLKLLNSAVANAKNNFQLDPANLYISKITVDEGRIYKRWRARARGRAAAIQKKTSHINLILDEIKPSKKAKKKVEEKSKAPKVAVKKEVKKETEEPVKEKKPFPKEKPDFVKQPKKGFGRGLRRIFRRKSF